MTSVFRGTLMRMAFPNTIAALRPATLATKLGAPRTALKALRYLSGATKSPPMHAATPSTKIPHSDLMHFHAVNELELECSHHPHPIWTDEELYAVKMEHFKPVTVVDKLAYATVWLLRQVYDIGTGYRYGTREEMCFLRRIIFLETIAGVPGMVGAAVRHFHSLRHMERDYGWIHTLLEEAENERMHLMCAILMLRKPSWLIRYCVIGAQYGFVLWYAMMYMISPRYCHRFVGYIEEEAVKTYTGMVNYTDKGKSPLFMTKGNPTSIAYWQMPLDSTVRDVILNIRADESHHQLVNHHFAEMFNACKQASPNPFLPGF